MRFLKWLKMHPLYGGRYRSKEFRDKSIEFFWAIDCNSAINETLAYLVDSIIGEETSLCGTRDNIKIGDIKFLVSNGLLPGDYFSSDILDKYTDEDLVTKGFYKTLKILYESRFNDDGKPILVRMQGIIESESRKDNPDIGLLYAIADYCLRAEEYETAKDLFVKIQAMQNKDKGTQTVCLVKLTEVNKKQKDAQSSQISESEREEIRQVLERMLENRSIMQDFIDASRHYGLLAQNVREVILWLDKDKKLENLLLLEIAHRKKKIKDFEARYVFKPYAPNKELLQEYEDLLYLYKILGMDSEAEGCEKKIEEILDEMLREEDMWRQVAKDEEKRRREQELMMRNIGNWSKFDWRSINRMQNFGDMDWRKMIDASVIFPDIHKIEPFKPIFVIKDSVIGRLTRLIEELAEGYENKYRSKIDDEKIARQIEAEGIIYNEYIIKRVYKSHSIVLLYLKTLWELIRQLVSRNISIRDAWKTFKDMNKIMKGYFSKNKKESNEKKKPSGGARKRVGDYDTDVKMTREEERYLDDLVSEEPAELRRSYEGISYKCIYYARSSELGRFLESKGVEGAYNFKGYILVEVGEEQARNWYYYGRTIKLTGEQNDALRHEELELFWGSHTLAWTYQIWEAFQNKKEDSKDMTIERLQIFVESQIDQMSYSDLIRFIEDTRERQHNIIRHAIRKYRFPQALSAVSQFELSAKEYAGRRLRLYIHRDVKRLERLLNEEWKRYETQLEESREIEEWFSVLRGNVGSLKFSIERMPEIIAPEGIGSVLRVTKLISRQSEHISKLRELLNNEIRGKYLASTVVFESEAEAFSKEYGELYDILTAIYNSPEEVFNEAQAIYVKVSEALAIINQDTRSNTRYKINQIRDLRKELSKALISIIGEKLNLMEKEIIDICSRANIFRQAYGNDEGVRYMLDIISASVYSIREKSVKVSSAYNYSEVDDVLRLLQLLYNCKVSIISLRNHIDGQSMDEFTRKYKGKNYYKVLGVPKGAGQDVIKGAFRQLALRYHPDRNPGNKEAEERFKEATEAYKALTEQREEYDILLAQNAGRNISSEARSAGYYGGDNKEFNTEIRDALGVDDNGKVIEGAERSFTAVRYDVNAGQLETADIGVPDGQELTESEKANLLKVIGLLSEGDISILGTISIVFIPGIKPHYGLGRAQVYLDRALLSDGETNALRVRLYHEVQERQRVIAKMDEYDKDWRQKRGDSAIEKAISKFAEDAHKELVAEEISDLLGLQAEEKQNIAKILTGQEMNIDLLHALREILISGKITKEKFVEAITNSAKEVVDLLNIIQDAVPEKDKDNVEEALSMYLSLVKLNKMGEKKTMPEFMNKLRSALEKTGKGAKIINDLINDLWNMEGYSVEDGKIVQSQYFALMLDGLRTFLEVKEGSDADKYLKILDEYKFRLAQVKNKFKLAETIFTDSGDEIFNALTGYLKLRQEEKLDLVAEVIARFMAYGENEGENEIISLMDDDSKKRYVKEGIQKLVSRKGLNSIGEEKPKDTLLDGLIEQGTARAKKGYEIAEGVLDKVIGESKWSSGLPLVIEDSLVGVGVKNLLQARAREGKLVIICKGEEKRAVINKWLSENEIGAAQFVDSYEETVGKAAVSMLTYETAEQNKDKINKHRVVRGTEKGEEDDLLLMSKIAGILGSVKELDKTVLEDPFRSLYTAYYHGAKSAEEIDELINKVMASIKDGAIFMELPPIAPFVKAYYNTLKTARELVATAA
jgi:phage-related protein